MTYQHLIFRQMQFPEDDFEENPEHLQQRLKNQHFEGS
jgi:hypothetical protein